MVISVMQKRIRPEGTLEQIVCNACGKKLRVENGIIKEGFFHGEDTFGYFSSRDREKYSFDLCESCFEELSASFLIPAEKEEIIELL